MNNDETKMNNDEEDFLPNETTPLVTGDDSSDDEQEPIIVDEEYTIPLAGVSPEYPSTTQNTTYAKRMPRMSIHAMSDLVEEKSGPPPARMMTKAKSYSVLADGTVSNLTPLEMSRHELYDNIPFTAVFGLQRREHNMSLAVSNYAADLDALDADQTAFSKTKKHLSSKQLQSRKSMASGLLLDELEHDNVVVTTPLICAVLVAAMSQFLVGYNTGVMNAPEKVVFMGHTTLEWSCAVAAFAVGGPFGANLAGNLAETKGRRGAIVINTWTFLLGGLMQTFANNMYVIIAARFVIGFASGVSSVLVPIYLGELAPPTLRGTLGTLTQFALVVGILVSDFFAFPFATDTKWRVLFSITVVVAVLQLFAGPWMLESPRWLLNKNPESMKARFIIKKLRGFRYDHEVDTEVDHFVSASRNQNMESSGKNKSSGGFGELFRDRNVRLLVVSCFILQMTQQLCGINAVFYYSTAIFDGVISNPLVGTTLVGAVNVVATYIALLLMDSCGRRTLLLWSTGGMFLSCVVLVMALKGLLSNVYALVAVNVYVSFFEIGLGPIPSLIVAEMFDAKYVALAMSASSQVNWVCNFIVGLVFPYLNELLGPYSFVPFAGVLLLGFLFTAIWLPETQGSSPAELQAELVKKNSNTVYHNMSFVNLEGQGAEFSMMMEQIREEEDSFRENGADLL